MTFDFLELAKFNSIKYYDAEHKYYIGDTEFTSATTFIGKFKPKFDTQRIAEEYANKRGLDVNSVIAEWDLKRDVSTFKGTLVHSLAENWWNNKFFPYNPSESVKAFGHDIITEKYEKCRDMFFKFYEDAKQNLVPVKMELVVGDEEYKIAGQIDGLFFNKKSNELEIWDYKTNKEIKYSNDFGQKFQDPISHLDVCEFNTYSLQLSLYKHIIQKNTNLKIGSNYLVWINENISKYKVIKCQDMEAEIKLMINHLAK